MSDTGVVFLSCTLCTAVTPCCPHHQDCWGGSGILPLRLWRCWSFWPTNSELSHSTKCNLINQKRYVYCDFYHLYPRILFSFCTTNLAPCNKIIGPFQKVCLAWREIRPLHLDLLIANKHTFTGIQISKWKALSVLLPITIWANYSASLLNVWEIEYHRNYMLYYCVLESIWLSGCEQYAFVNFYLHVITDVFISFVLHYWTYE